jgi:hypothetical protein
VYLAFHHEPEPSQDGLDFGTPAEFVSAWKHVHDRFAADGVTNVSWIMVLLSSSYGSGVADDYYPGDSYVDVLGADGYNWYGCASHIGADWRSFSDIFDGFHAYGVAKGKPVMVAEYGLGEDSQDPARKAQWFTDALATLKGWPEMKAVLYYDHNEDDTCVFWVGSSGASTAAFQAIGADPYLNPPPPLVWITSGPDVSTNRTSATFVFSANERGVTYTCSVDRAPSDPCASGVTYTNIVQGDHSFQVVGTDRNGTTGAATYSWSVDSIAPLVLVTSGPPDPSKSTRATFTFKSNEDDATFTCQVDAETPFTCSSGVVVGNLSIGSHIFTVFATDPAGNDSLPALYLWHVLKG